MVTTDVQTTSGPFATTQDGTRIFYKDRGSDQPVVPNHGWPPNADLLAFLNS